MGLVFFSFSLLKANSQLTCSILATSTVRPRLSGDKLGLFWAVDKCVAQGGWGGGRSPLSLNIYVGKGERVVG